MIDNALTVGELRAALDGIPDGEPVMLLVDASNAAWLRQVRHDLGGHTLDMIGGKDALGSGAAPADPSQRWPILAERRPGEDPRVKRLAGELSTTQVYVLGTATPDGYLTIGSTRTDRALTRMGLVKGNGGGAGPHRLTDLGRAVLAEIGGRA